MMLSFYGLISGCYLGAWCRGYHARSVLICEGLIRSCVINIISSECERSQVRVWVHLVILFISVLTSSHLVEGI